MTIKVAIADDQALVRGGFVVLVQAAADMVVVGEAADGAAGRRAGTRPASRRGADGRADAPARRHRGHQGDHRRSRTAGSRVLILTTFDLDDYVYRALRAGASGFLLKDTAPEDMLAAIRTLAAGDALLAPGITRRLIREFAARPSRPTGPRRRCSSLCRPESGRC